MRKLPNTLAVTFVYSARFKGLKYQEKPESIYRLRWKISVLIKNGLVLGSQFCFLDVFHAKLFSKLQTNAVTERKPEMSVTEHGAEVNI